MTYEAFEKRLLHLAFTTDLPLTPQTVAFALELPVAEAQTMLNDLVAHDVLTVEHDDNGQARYQLPSREEARRATRPIGSLVSQPGLVVRPPTALAPPPRTTLQVAVAAAALNILFLPGLGTLVAGRRSPGATQLTLTLIALPLCLIAIGIPLLIATWCWGVATSVRLLAEHTSDLA